MNRDREKKGVRKKVCVGNPLKHKATVCDTRGQCSLAISVVGQNHKPEKSASQAKALLKKTTVLKKHSLQGSVLSYTISFEALCDVQVLVTQNAFIF